MKDTSPGLSREWLVALHQITQILSKSLSEVSGVLSELLSRGAGAAEELTDRSPPSLPRPGLSPAPVEPRTTEPVFEEGTADLVPIEHAARIYKLSPTSIYGLIQKGVITKHNPYGGRAPFVSRKELDKAAAFIRPRKSSLPEGCVSPVIAAGMIGVSTVHFYTLVKRGLFKGVEKSPVNGRMAVPLTSVEAFLNEKQLEKKYPKADLALHDRLTAEGKSQTTLIEFKSPSSTSIPTAIPKPEPTITDHYNTILSALEEEVQQLGSYLGDMAPSHQSAQLSVWAGTARKVAADDAVSVETRQRAWQIITQLRPLAERYGAWVNALYADWEIEDWNVYIKANAVAGRPELSPEEQEVLAESELRGILVKSRRMDQVRALEVVARCKAMLGEEHPLVTKATRIYSAPKDTSTTHAPVVADLPSNVPAHVLSLTKGKRVLIVGGQGDRSESCREFMKQLQLSACEWITHERDRPAQVLRAKSRVSPRNFDLMIYLKHFTGHNSTAMVAAAKKTKLPVVNVPRGYSVSSIATAIEEQYTPLGASGASGAPGTPKSRPAPAKSKAHLRRSR